MCLASSFLKELLTVNAEPIGVGFGGTWTWTSAASASRYSRDGSLHRIAMLLSSSIGRHANDINDITRRLSSRQPNFLPASL